MSHSNCVFLTHNDKCGLRLQKSFRGLTDDAWRSDSINKNHTGCIFKEISPLIGSCPEFSENGEELWSKELSKQENLYPVDGEVLQPNDPLYLSKQEFKETHDNYIYFCEMEGPIHASVCVGCPNHDGKSPVGCRFDRNPQCCRMFGNHNPIGRINNGQLEFRSQREIDADINQKHSRSWSKTRTVLVPLARTEIKSAYLPDIPRWDYQRYSFEFCIRCGPQETGSIRFHCPHCRAKDLCENCLQKFSCLPVENEKLNISFQCPDCKQITDWQNFSKESIGRFLKTNPSHVDDSYYPVDYATLLERRNMPLGSIIAAISSNLCASQISGKPTVDGNFITITEGLMKGEYYIDDHTKKAWRYNRHPNTQSIRKNDSGVSYQDFSYDVLISYRNCDFKMAHEVQASLNEYNLSTYLIQESHNVWNCDWPLRFAEAMHKGKVTLCLLTQEFIAGQAGMTELEEANNLQLIRKNSWSIPDSLVHGLSTESFNKILAGVIPNFISIPISTQLSELVNKISITCRTLTREHYLQLVKPILQRPKDHSYEKSQQLCLNCKCPIYFHGEFDNIPIEDKFDAIGQQGLVAACSKGHRFCSKCGIGSQWNPNCPKCNDNGTYSALTRLSQNEYYS